MTDRDELLRQIGEETWKKLPEWPYEISDKGRVKRTDTDHILRLGDNGSGYKTVHLCRDGERKPALVHRLVLTVFEGACPEGHQADHINSKKDDNRFENLRWLPAAENSRQATLGEKCANAKLTEVEVVDARWRFDAYDVRIADLARFYDVGWKTMRDLLHGETWKHIGGPTISK